MSSVNTVKEAAKQTPYDSFMERFNAAADIINLDERYRAIMGSPEKIIQVSLPIKLDNGNATSFSSHL